MDECQDGEALGSLGVFWGHFSGRNLRNLRRLIATETGGGSLVPPFALLAP